MLPEHWWEEGGHAHSSKWWSVDKMSRNILALTKLTFLAFKTIICSCTDSIDVMAGYSVSCASLTSNWDFFSDLYITISTWEVERATLNNISVAFTEMWDVLWWKRWASEDGFWRHDWGWPVSSLEAWTASQMLSSLCHPIDLTQILTEGSAWPGSEKCTPSFSTYLRL